MNNTATILKNKKYDTFFIQLLKTPLYMKGISISNGIFSNLTVINTNYNEYNYIRPARYNFIDLFENLSDTDNFIELGNVFSSKNGNFIIIDLNEKQVLVMYEKDETYTPMILEIDYLKKCKLLGKSKITFFDFI